MEHDTFTVHLASRRFYGALSETSSRISTRGAGRLTCEDGSKVPHPHPNQLCSTPPAAAVVPRRPTPGNRLRVRDGALVLGGRSLASVFHPCRSSAFRKPGISPSFPREAWPGSDAADVCAAGGRS